MIANPELVQAIAQGYQELRTKYGWDEVPPSEVPPAICAAIIAAGLVVGKEVDITAAEVLAVTMVTRGGPRMQNRAPEDILRSCRGALKLVVDAGYKVVKVDIMAAWEKDK